MNFNKRQIYIINNFINQNNLLTVDCLTDRFKVDKRTIYYDIDNLNSSLDNYGIKIDTNKGFGLKLTGNINNIKKIIRDNFEENYDFSKSNRLDYIIKKLFIEGGSLSYSYLSERWYVSRTTIKYDFDYFRNLIESRNIKLVSNNKGTFVEGDEKEIINFSSHYLINKIENKKIDYHDMNFIFQYLNKFFEKELVDDVYGYLRIINKKSKKSLTTNYLLRLLVTSIIQIRRISKGHHINTKEKELFFDNIDNIKFFPLTSIFIENIEKHLFINYITDDKLYLNEHFVAFGLEPSYLVKDEEYEQIIQRAINKVSSIMHVDLSNDLELIEGLRFHVYPMIYRLKMGISLPNPFLDELKQQFSILFNATWYAFYGLLSEKGIVITEDEVSYLMIHFQASIDKNIKRTNVLIVCPLGMGLSNLVRNRIEKNSLPNVIIETTSIIELKTLDISQVDLIISTVELNDIKINKPIIHVSPLINYEDQKKIAEYFLSKRNQVKFSANKENGKFKTLLKFISEDYIYYTKESFSKEVVLSKICTDLCDKGFIKREFFDSVIDRERISSTYLGNGIAIPHGNIESVNETVIAIINTEDSINWGDDKASLIFLICISKKDLTEIKDVFNDLYQVIDSEYLIEKIKKSNNAVEAINILRYEGSKYD